MPASTSFRKAQEQQTVKCGTLASSAFVLVFSGLVLGLGWAVRGVFGHEWGASWAGSMGALGVVVAVNRRDWLRRAPILACLGGVGWGVGGTMSYGLMVASGRGIHFMSVAYGYAMLILVGGLYGFVGGGLFGLGLESGPRNAEWHRLITEMVAFGCLAYVVIIGALEWRMTPPRHESWAACLGASAALGWFLHRGGYHRALRTACYASLGAGIGFSFGNLIQTLNMVIGTGINGWNIMEFLLGFGGGVGMAYAVLSRDWPETITPSRGAHWGALLFLAAGIPVVNRAAAFSMDKFTGAAESLGMVDPAGFAARQLTTASGVVIVMTALVPGVFLALSQSPEVRCGGRGSRPPVHSRLLFRRFECGQKHGFLHTVFLWQHTPLVSPHPSCYWCYLGDLGPRYAYAAGLEAR